MSSPRRLELLGGRLLLDASLFPFLGPPDAPHLIAVLSDYTCEHCRAMHPILESALRQTGGQLAALILTAPLERACNPFIQITDPRYANACAYARLALALWVARPEHFATFHRFLYEGVRPPPLNVARRRAAELLGIVPSDDDDAALDAATGDPLVQQKLADALTIYRSTGSIGTTAGAVGALPRLILPSGILHGGVSSSDKFMALLRGQLLGASGAAPAVSRPPPSPPAAATNVFSSRPIGDA